MSTIERDGRSVHYARHRGAGPTLLLIHGWATSSRIWDTVVTHARAAGRDVLAVDLRGSGRSDPDFAVNTVDALGSDVAAIASELDLERVVLNGWSMGGAVAVDAAFKIGPRLAGLVLTAAASPRFTACPDWPYGAPVEIVDGLLAAAASNRPAMLCDVRDSLCVAEIGQPARDLLWSLMLGSAPAIDEALRDLGTVDQRAALAQLTSPVLLMAGEQDSFVSLEGVRKSLALFGSAPKLVTFTDSGHIPFLEETEKYLRELDSFLANI
jgi:non-heme chloroperoxidase